ncbi:hypothetical protein ACHAXM_006373 [Skeletonema potamos]|jgi:deoxyribodipyrimidine photo-lyase
MSNNQSTAAKVGAPIDVVWLKKDVRLHDHGPLLSITLSNRQCIILYLYEPDQLSEKTVHGSHIAFINEGLVDLDLRLSSGNHEPAATTASDTQGRNIYEHKFQCITVCHAGAAFTLRSIHKQRPINQILCHMESSHLKSFARDKAVRRWCRHEKIPIREVNQTGVTRCLSDRDDFATNFNKFLGQPIHATPTKLQLEGLRSRLVNIDRDGIELHGICYSPMKPSDMQEIPIENRCDRKQRQYGGEAKALDYFRSFLTSRGANYSAGISSPNSSWTTGSRLSPYLTWGHISLRYVIVATKRKQEELRTAKKDGPSTPSPWLRSLASFQSRMHWRSHFIQKLESQPSLEKQDQCLAFSHLRRQPGDFNEKYFDAWCEGRTGFPFVDACMRSLIHTGWLNFRMRAMLVSFATYNLWLDWKKLASHLGRLFLDYEPGIHYPQLQMQAGTTGINAMRVYNVTKQGKDQDPNGVFIKKYVPELASVPDEYIHEPHTMPVSVQKKCGVVIGDGKGGEKKNKGIFQTQQSTSVLPPEDCVYYPSPIVDEKITAKSAKDRLSAVRKQDSTKREAEQVYLKHGSRRTNGDRDGIKPKALSSNSKRIKVDGGQQSLLKSLNQSQNGGSSKGNQTELCAEQARDSSDVSAKTISASVDSKSSLIESLFSKQKNANNHSEQSKWSCKACTFLNDKPLGLVCAMCGSVR